MNKPQLLDGTVHKLPRDLKDSLVKNVDALKLWQKLTPLARNEFICWVKDAKQAKTRQKRIDRTISELREGKRRPCCWIGCVHRNEKPPSKSQKGILKL
jgi:uncharacterized protein YdeI (YjbR/CyaY-like superfamily)